MPHFMIAGSVGAALQDNWEIIISLIEAAFSILKYCIVPKDREFK